jgi:hypothetical protein
MPGDMGIPSPTVPAYRGGAMLNFAMTEFCEVRFLGILRSSLLALCIAPSLWGRISYVRTKRVSVLRTTGMGMAASQSSHAAGVRLCREVSYQPGQGILRGVPVSIMLVLLVALVLTHPPQRGLRFAPPSALHRSVCGATITIPGGTRTPYQVQLQPPCSAHRLLSWGRSSQDRAPASIMLHLAALVSPPRAWRGLPFVPRFVARNLEWCDHVCPRWDGHNGS